MKSARSIALLLSCLATAIAARHPDTASATPEAKIVIDYPAADTLFPPDISAPTILWRDQSEATTWMIEVRFAERAKHIVIQSSGERMHVGEIDTTCVGFVPPKLTPEQAAAHTWRPDEGTWSAIKKHSVRKPATLIITGFREGNRSAAVSQAELSFQTSKDPVGAPIFYRDVPLIPVETQRGVIQPLPKGSIPLIKWRLRNVSERSSHTVLQNVPTCINCHSFSRDGRALGLDVDGPQNDKGLYALVPVQKTSVISNENVIRWSAFSEEVATKRFGFMSQISPDGNYVITTIEDPGRHVRGLDDRFYNAGYRDYKFGQVFYPTKGILAWYSKDTKKLQPLPGANLPEFVQASAFWSPDGKYLVYSRTKAVEPYHEGQADSTYANSPDETQIQYDLYRIPFNNGQGGTAERIEGASQNGMSNNFPKVSPDGKWIVYVQCKNGLLMRPDSKLYIVPFAGGVARPLRSNTPLMNSWHSFSPNGKWLVFSSKSRSPYTQMFLTHIDDNGNDSPPILIEEATAANRAVNIPEFANIRPGDLDKIDAPATEFYRLFDVALELAKKGDYSSALAEWQKAVAINPDDAKARFNLAVALQRQGRTSEAINQYRKSLDFNPGNYETYTNLAVALAASGNLDEAIDDLIKAIRINPDDAKAHADLAGAFIEKGRVAEAIPESRWALQLDPDNFEAHINLALALMKTGDVDEAITHFDKGLANDPDAPGLQYQFARALLIRGRMEEAVPHLEKAAGIGEPTILGLLASVYAREGRFGDAASTARKALVIATEQKKSDLIGPLESDIRMYESSAGKRR